MFLKYLPKKLILIVGAGKAGRALYAAVKDDPRYEIVGFIDDDPKKWGVANSPAVFGGYTELKEKVEIHGVEAIIMAITHLKGPELLKCTLDSKMEGIQVYDMPSFYEEVTGKVPVEHVDDFWLVSTPIAGVKKSTYNLKFKRMLDLILSLLGIIITLPVMVIAAIAIKLESPGPVFYRQRRVGLNGMTFYLFKFRTMKVGSEGDRKYAGRKDDPRITRAGRFIRRYRIDEIPQMWNVLKGEMSFIGPRALIEEEIKEFEKKVPYFPLRHSVRPGITGWAQVNYRHGVTVEDALEKLQYDIFYIKNLSPILDFHILLKTVKVVSFGKGG